MAQDRGLVQRGLVLLAFVGALSLLVVFILLRQPGAPPEQQPATPQPELVALGVPNLAAGFPAHVQWGALWELSQSLPSPLGWEIRYNAALALARRGSPKVPLHIMAEMLDESLQMRNFRAKLPDGKDVADEQAARRTVLNALLALTEWHKTTSAVNEARKEQPDQLRRVFAAVNRLTSSDNAVVREEAAKTKKSLGI
jgi:hypothetical protein